MSTITETETAPVDPAKVVITELENRIADELTPIDGEAAFAECLDESGPVDVAGMTFYPSRIWQELDPIAFRCGVADYLNSLGTCEVGNPCDNYYTVECERIKDEIVYDLQSQLEDAQDEDADSEDIAIYEAKLAALKKHSF